MKRLFIILMLLNNYSYFNAFKLFLPTKAPAIFFEINTVAKLTHFLLGTTSPAKTSN